MSKVEIDEASSEIKFTTVSGDVYVLMHEQDCCEHVYIEDVNGDLSDLVGSPITQAEESTNHDDPPAECADESYTWTFFKLATIRGYVTIRFFGTSNGYYGEDARLYKENRKRK